jgi:hypothetical protein
MSADAVTPPTFADGFGTRLRLSEADAAEPLEVLHVSRVLTSTSGFDFALRERVSRLANFRHAYYGRVRRVDRIENGGTLGLVSEYAEGARLSHVLEVARACDLDLDINAALCLLRQIVPAVAMLHQNARDASHGALAPERIVVTPNARVVLVEYVLGAAIESLGYSRERLWKDLRVAVPPGAGSPRLNHRADVMQIGVVALSLVLGRPLADDDPRQLPGLLAAATENSVMGGREPISESLRRWLTRALQLDPRGSFESALEAQLALDDVLSGEAGYIAAPVALESFLARYHESASKVPVVPKPAPVADPPPPVVEAFTPQPVMLQEATPTSPPVSPAKLAVPPPTPKLGVARVSADAPAVVSFRAVATPTALRPVVIEPIAASTAPEPVLMPEPAPAPPPPVEPPAPMLAAASRADDEEDAFDETALRAQFLAASASSPAEAPAGVPGWWRIAAMALAVVALGEGAFIGWRLASSPTGLSGSNGMLKVESKPVGAQVKVDGEVKGVTPLSLPLGAGAHVMEIAAGAEPRVIPITISAGETLAQYVELAGTSALGRVSIQSSPAGATVLLDGQPRGTTPLELADVAAGDHELVLDLNGQRQRQTLSVAAGTTTTINQAMNAATGAQPIDAAGLLSAAPVTGTVIVQVPFEMQVFEHGTLIGVSGSRLSLPPGPHAFEVVSETLSFRAPARVDVVAGKTSRIPIALPKGTMHLNATPWAEVWIDGVKIGDTPIGNLPVTIGPHEIVFKHPELGEQAHAATVTAGAPVRLSVDLTKPR